MLTCAAAKLDGDATLDNFGLKERVAIVMSKTIYTEILTKLGRYAESEEVFYTLITKERYSQLADEDGDYPDRLTNLWLLAQCLEEQGKYAEALKIFKEFEAALTAIGGHGQGMRHKILLRMKEKISDLQRAVSEARIEANVDEEVLTGV